MSRVHFFLAGESGMGINSSGEIVMMALAAMGYWVSSDREFPSLIKGGESSFNVFCDGKPVHGESTSFQIGVGMGKVGLLHALKKIEDGGTILHNFEKWELGVPDLMEQAAKRNLKIHYLGTRETIKKLKIHTVFENTIAIGALAKAMNIDFSSIQDAAFKRYGKKESLRKMNLECLKKGYEMIDNSVLALPEITEESPERMLVDGNTALAMGAIHAGMRTYFAYPMSPSTSVLLYIAATAKETGVVVKQVEDEITAVQMNLGSMYAGARSLTVTSGGGFDLMTETISLSGMTEIPLVVAIAQRPGPATGLPTRTAQGDLNLALYAGHGEFARIVMAVSDQRSAFDLVQHAYNLAEEFQVPVIILTEKIIADKKTTIPVFELNTIPMTRGLVTDSQELVNLQPTDRYKITDSGVSKRRRPGDSETVCFSNGDEHNEDGTLNEEISAAHMIDKRIRKLYVIEKALPEPVIYGEKGAEILYIGRGSTKGVMLDSLDQCKHAQHFNYCHVEYLFPLKRASLKAICSRYKKIYVFENNQTSQYHSLLKKEFGEEFVFVSCVKFNGRQFVIEEILEAMDHHFEHKDKETYH